MSLAVLADHMASKGRGPDSMLIHMSPREVQGLQALAVKNGGSLTINPETGLPEANFLEKLLPSLIGFGVSYLSGGAISPTMAGLGVGAVEAARTGDLGRGISAGLGAYGGAGLGAGLLGAGTNVLSGEATNLAANEAGRLAGEEALRYGAEQGLTTEAAEALKRQAIDSASEASSRVATSAGPFDRLSAGAKAVTSSPSAFGGFAKDNFKYLAAGAAPILADQAVKSNMPTTTTRPGQMSTYSFDPYTQRYTSTGNYEVPRKAKKEEDEETAADGGLMGMYDGGYSPGQLNFAQRSEPVVRMADGGDTLPVGSGPRGPTMPIMDSDNPLGSPGNMPFPETEDKFGTPPRTDFSRAQAAGTGGLDYQTLVSSLQNSPLTAAQRANPSSQYQATVDYTSPTVSDDMVQKAYQEVWGRAAAPWEVEAWQGVAGDATEKALSKAPIQTQVADMYRNVLGRDADPGGLATYTDRIAAFNPVMLSAGQRPEQVYEDFLRNARTSGEIFNTDPARSSSYASAVTPYTGYQSADRTNIVDEWVRNTLGREVTAADKTQAWYKDAFDATKTIPDLKNLYGQFQTYAKADSAATTAQKIREATASLAARGMTEADVLRQTGKTVAQLVASDIDFDKDIFAASQLRAPGARTGFDFNSIRNPYGNATNPGDKTYNPDGSITVTPNIPGRPYGGFSGMDEVKDAYTAGGGSLGYTSYAPKTIEEFDKKYNKQTGGSKQAYDYLMGKSNYSATPYTATGEVMKPYSESVLGVPANIASKKVLFDPVTRKYKVNPDYIPVSYTPEGKRVVGKSDREVADALTSTTVATGGLLSLATGGSATDTKAYEQWLKTNNITIEQVARALGISVAEAKKRYNLKGDAKDTGMGLGEYSTFGGSSDPYVDSNPAWTNLSDKGRAEFFEQNPLQANIAAYALGAAKGMMPGYGLINGLPIALGYLANMFDSKSNNFAPVESRGTALNEVVSSRNQDVQDNDLDAIPGSYTWGGGLMGTLGDQEGDYDGQGTTNTGVVVGGPIQDDTYVQADLGQLDDGADDIGGSPDGSPSGSGVDSAESASPDGFAYGGIAALARGGMYNLGDYSDGGRLLRGPGDGTSDSIPAMIGKKQPARLADGEFVVPARIVSELGNGSTEAGARKLYAMMDRIQAARRNSIGKGKVAKNSRADKYLPA